MFKKILENIKIFLRFPYVICWTIIAIYVIISRMKNIYQKIKDGAEKDDVEKYVWSLIDEYIAVMEKLKPHIIGCFWILVLLLIFK